MLSKMGWRNTLHGSMTWDDDVKWSMPGWRDEMRYTEKALVGNWFERRHPRCPGKLDFLTSNGEQFKSHTSTADFLDNIRQGIMSCQRNERGNGKEVFAHHGNIYAGLEYLSQYDEEYNKNRALDAKRVWDKHLCKWVPERVDIPVMSRGNDDKREYITLPPIQSLNNINRSVARGPGRQDKFTRSIMNLRKSPFNRARLNPINPIIYWE